MARYNVHAGHCPQNKGAHGAVGLLKESIENRIVKNEVIRLLKAEGHTVFDCTCDEKTTKDVCLKKIVEKCNRNKVDLDISIHLNDGRNDYRGDDSTGGVEVFCYNSKNAEVAGRICVNIAKILSIRNRGVKYSTSLYVLRKTKSPAILIECCFVDDADDAQKWDAKKCAKAIVEAILNKNIEASKINADSSDENKGHLPYKVKITANVLNVRNGAGTKYKVNTTVKKGDVYTIIKESNGWGKLKSGAGWLCLDYTKRI